MPETDRMETDPQIKAMCYIRGTEEGRKQMGWPDPTMKDDEKHEYCIVHLGMSEADTFAMMLRSTTSDQLPTNLRPEDALANVIERKQNYAPLSKDGITKVAEMRDLAGRTARREERLASTIPTTATCEGCGRQFAGLKPQVSLGNHQRHCDNFKALHGNESPHLTA